MLTLKHRQVAGTTDQVDVNYTIVETSGGQLGAGIGFSQTQGLIFNANVSQSNIFGTGNRLNFQFNNSDVNTRYGLGYSTPYFTDDGIGSAFDIFYRKTNAEDANLAIFETKEWGGTSRLSIPVTEYNTIGTSFGYTNTEIDTEAGTSEQITDFIASNGNQYDILRFGANFSYDTRNKLFYRIKVLCSA